MVESSFGEEQNGILFMELHNLSTCSMNYWRIWKVSVRETSWESATSDELRSFKLQLRSLSLICTFIFSNKQYFSKLFWFQQHWFLSSSTGDRGGQWFLGLHIFLRIFPLQLKKSLARTSVSLFTTVEHASIALIVLDMNFIGDRIDRMTY